MEYFNRLPEEITLDIFIRLPVESILEFKLVSTNWRNFLGRPSFYKAHSKHHIDQAGDSGKLSFVALTSTPDLKSEKRFQYFEYIENEESIERIRRLNINLTSEGWAVASTKFLCSCNGLICLAREQYLGEFTYIFNPITREYIMLPVIRRVGMYYSGTGFGYVSSTNEYKVVAIMCELDTNLIEVHIYTLGSRYGWRNIGKFDVGNTRDCYLGPGHLGAGIFVNGTLYWSDDALGMIVTFDLAEETFCQQLSFPLPPDHHDFGIYYELGVLNGCLSFGVYGDDCWKVWLLKKNNDNCMKEREEHDQSLSWGEVFRVYDGKVFAITKSDGLLTCTINQIHTHDLQDSTSTIIVDFKECFSRIVPHKNTLVSLKELGEEDTKMMESVQIEET